MKSYIRYMLTALIALTFLAACGGKQGGTRDAGQAESDGQIIEGGLYCTPGEDGDYAVLKVLKVDQHGIHVRLYSNRYFMPPSKIDENTLYMAGMDRKPGEQLGMGHLPLLKRTFAGWAAKFVQRSTVTEAELEGYRVWLEDRGGYF